MLFCDRWQFAKYFSLPNNYYYWYLYTDVIRGYAAQYTCTLHHVNIFVEVQMVEKIYWNKTLKQLFADFVAKSRFYKELKNQENVISK